MEKMSINTIELGNLLFGNSRGQYHIDRDKWEEPFYEFLTACGFDGYGYQEKDPSADHFENDVFILRPYYWGDDDDIAALPNFVYKPKNIEISWYKYPLRDAYISGEMTDEEFLEMLADCRQSFL